MWRHLSIAVVALKTVVQRVRSNRLRFNFEMAIRTPLYPQYHPFPQIIFVYRPPTSLLHSYRGASLDLPNNIYAIN